MEEENLKDEYYIVLKKTQDGKIGVDFNNKNEVTKKAPFSQQLEWMGKKSLELYTAHIIILLVIYYVIFNKNKK